MTSKVFKTDFAKSEWVPTYNPDVSDSTWAKAVLGQEGIELFRSKQAGIAFDDIDSYRNTVPTDAITHKGLASYLFTCWRDEAGVVLRPDMISGAILQQVAKWVCDHPESCRELYSASADKTLMVVQAPADEISIEALTEMVTKDMKCKELSRAFLTNYDSAPATYQQFARMCLLQSGVSYYNYSSTRCGIPAVMITGEHKDWLKLLDMLLTLETIFSKIIYTDKWEDMLTSPIAKLAQSTTGSVLNIIKYAFEDNCDLQANCTMNGKTGVTKFFSDIFRIDENCGSGHPHYCRGWFNNFYIDGYANVIKSYPEGIAYVPYNDLDTKRMWYYACGLVYSDIVVDNNVTFYTPNYGSVKHEVTNEELFNYIAKK